nr:flagellar protein FlhE [Pantoea sp. 1.19]
MLSASAAAVSQSWSDSSIGPALSLRGVAASSPALGDGAARGTVTLVYWQYRLSGPMPAGLQVRLCADTRCVLLEGANGATRGLSNLPADEPLRFIYQVEGKGRVFPLTRVISNQVTVNYRTVR